jgi:uncharacterized protein YbjT (DUF2867 family)
MPSAPSGELHVVTGAFGFSGKYIARRLLDAGHTVRTLTNSINRPNPFAGAVEAAPLDFEHEDRLAESLRGAKVLYNTYWVRFSYGGLRQSAAVENTRALFRAARRADVGRVVHVSITNPSENSPLEYFRGKALLEKSLVESGLSYAILRPAALFGREDILINNIAWTVRKMPILFVFGKGDYHLQPIHVDDLAKLAVEQGRGAENAIINAIGPETFTYRQLVQMRAGALGKRRPIVSMPPVLGYLGATAMGWLMRDKLLTWEELEGLMADLLYVPGAPPAGETRLSDWAREHADTLGVHYTSELARRRNRSEAYERL